MNEQQDVSPSVAAEQELERPRRRREPSVGEVAEQIATNLGVTEDPVRERIRQIVWDFGRTQAQVLGTEALLSEVPVDRFFTLVETKGVKKQRNWVAPKPPSNEQVPRANEVTRLIAEQLGEQERSPQQMIYRTIQVLGVETALALLQQTHETEAAGGMLIPDGSRRRTPGGVFFVLVRQQASPEQHGAFPTLLTPGAR